MNLLIEKIRRVGHGYRNFNNYRLRLLLQCSVTWHDASTTRIRGRRPRVTIQVMQVAAVSKGCR